MHFKRLTLFFCFVLSISTSTVLSQDDLLDELDDLAKKDKKSTDKNDKNLTQFELPAFKTLKIGNLQSTKIAAKGELYLIVSHRFGPLKDGLDTFLGLDFANTKIELLYSFFDGIQFSISRESFEKTVALASKVRVARQSSSFPMNLAAYGTVNINAELSNSQFSNYRLKDADRFSYALQFLASRRISKNLSLELAPTYIRENLQILEETFELNHNQFAMGIGGRLKLSKRISFNAEYVHNFNRHPKSIYYNPYTFGVDIETGGHVFQLLFTNAQSTNEPGFISNANGDIAFGFNIVRVF
ncbi:hypothetical protein BTO06_00565 [Tenacibaculum sp. SZ-18]|uniref:DUF5777 family beta-barrel protein n=1 Tax=Tenacibaculum sp. SZ-18 TaxID=754423 RepID=UPI000C2D2D12|nr:DUF5777 family beta-barrel protein [Tenacibaculum sp. SZ-18]AUC13729.1 hypothetical protein BTO06_00565 [Tenacibaculum sp. SZ-18]